MSSTNYKMVFLGETAVGKSSLVIRFVKGEFSPTQEPTVGAAFLAKKLQSKTSITNFKFGYYRGAHVAFVVYDITSPDTFENSKKWIKELKKLGDPNVHIVLVGNKIDLVQERMLKKEFCKSYADKNGLAFFETSAKTSENVDQLFLTTTELFSKTKKQKHKKNQFSQTDEEDSFFLSSAIKNDQSGCC